MNLFCSVVFLVQLFCFALLSLLCTKLRDFFPPRIKILFCDGLLLTTFIIFLLGVKKMVGKNMFYNLKHLVIFLLYKKLVRNLFYLFKIQTFLKWCHADPCV